MTDTTNAQSNNADDTGKSHNSTDDPYIGRLIDDKIEIVSLLGRGGAGSVYKGYHRLLDQFVSIKILNSKIDSETAVQRFQKEAQVLNTLSHENIVKFQSFGRLPDNNYYMQLEYLEGSTLAEQLNKSGPLNSQTAIPIFSKICKALAYAHQRGVIHRDIKPANVFLCTQASAAKAAEDLAKAETESTNPVKLLDFGIFKAIHDENQNLTQTGLMLGSVNYMSPEQCRAEDLSSRSDIYSLGCLMYESLVGHPPMEDKTDLLIMSNHANKKISKVPSKFPINSRLEQSILRCLEKESSARYPNCAELEADLSLSETSDDPGQHSHNRLLLGLSLGTVAILIASFSFAEFKSQNASNQPAAKTQLQQFRKTREHTRDRAKDRASAQPNDAEAQTRSSFKSNDSLWSSKVNERNLAPIESLIARTVNRNSSEIPAHILAETFNACAVYRIENQLVRDGCPPGAAEIESLLKESIEANEGSPKEQISQLFQLIRFYAIAGKYDEMSATLQRLENKCMQKSDDWKLEQCARCFASTVNILSIQMNLGESKKLIAQFRKFAEKVPERKWISVQSLQAQADFEILAGHPKSAQELVLTASSQLGRIAAENDYPISPDHETFKELCHLLGRFGKSAELIKLTTAVCGDYPQDSKAFKIGGLRTWLQKAEAHSICGDYHSCKKICEVILAKTMKKSAADELNDDIEVCLLGATKNLGGSSATIDQAVNYLDEVANKAMSRYPEALDRVSEALTKLDVPQGEPFWKPIDEMAGRYRESTPDFYRAILAVHLNEALRTKKSNILALATGMLPSLEKRTEDPERYVKFCLSLLAVFTGLHKVEEGQRVLDSSRQYSANLPPYLEFQYEESHGIFLKITKGGLKASALSIENLLRKWEKFPKEQLDSYADAVDYLACCYESLLQDEKAWACLEKGLDTINRERPQKLKEKIMLVEHMLRYAKFRHDTTRISKYEEQARELHAQHLRK